MICLAVIALIYPAVSGLDINYKFDYWIDPIHKSKLFYITVLNQDSKWSRIVYFIVAKETWYTGSKTERILEVVHQARKLIGLFLKMLDILLFSDWSIGRPMSKAPIKQREKRLLGHQTMT